MSVISSSIIAEKFCSREEKYHLGATETYGQSLVQLEREVYSDILMMAAGVGGTGSGASASRKSVTSPLLLLMLLLIQSHLDLGVVVAAGRHQRHSSYENNDIGSRWTTASRSVTSSVTSSAFVFRDCGKRD